MIYLASPYTHAKAGVRHERYREVVKCAAAMMRDGHEIYSPIGASHPMVVEGDLEFSHDQWLQYDRWFLDRCDAVWVLQLPGWRDSKGVCWEIGYAVAHDKPIEFIEWKPCTN